MPGSCKQYKQLVVYRSNLLWNKRWLLVISNNWDGHLLDHCQPTWVASQSRAWTRPWTWSWSWSRPRPRTTASPCAWTWGIRRRRRRIFRQDELVGYPWRSSFDHHYCDRFTNLLLLLSQKEGGLGGASTLGRSSCCCSYKRAAEFAWSKHKEKIIKFLSI